MMSKFEHGAGLLIFDGDWESGNFDKHMPGKVGFFLMPPLKAGGKHAAMSAPLTYGIAATREARRLRRVLPQLGRDEPDGPEDQRR